MVFGGFIIASWGFSTLADDLSRVIVFPNPWILHKHRSQGITFDNLTDMATIMIFNISGEEIERFEKDDKDVRYIWKKPNLASGVYIYIITNPKGEKHIGKLGVIK